MQPFSVTFTAQNGVFTIRNNCNRQDEGITVMLAQNTLTVSMCYNFRQTPLKLTAHCRESEKAVIHVRPYRIELWIGGQLKDEEWPCGDLLLDPLTAVHDAPFPVLLRPLGEDKDISPSILYSFENAEGWKPDEHVFVGDCMPYTYNNRYHVLYLKDRHHHMSKWGLGAHQWEHISTADFIHWQAHPTAVAITRPWEGSICTGSWIANGDRQYLYYTIRMADGSAAPICRSISTDGYHFEKDNDFHFVLPAHYNGPIARDPKVVLGKDHLFHMILTTSLIAEKKGCLAHLVSPDLENWSDAGPIYISPDATEPECPDYFEMNGVYYLVFSRHSVAEYRYSTDPFEGWKTPANPFIPCASVPKGAIWGDRVIFTGYQSGDRRRYAGCMTFSAATQNETGELTFSDQRI